MMNDFVLLRFWARAPEDLSAIEVIYIIIITVLPSLIGNMTKVDCGIAKGDL